jgi:putative transposase
VDRFFFTLVAHRRHLLFDDQNAISLLGDIFRECMGKWPVTVNAIVLLPDHLHTIWSLPPGDDQYPKRWGWLKKEFTQRWSENGGKDNPVSSGRVRQRRRGIWQPRYWEHTLEDESDFQAHFDYIHWNPVKHGSVNCPHEWAHSSFHRYVEAGIYHRNWAV